MRIVCLGWGSLIWDPRCLRLVRKDRPWRGDGPELPIEFARQSTGARLTLVVVDGAPLVNVLWAEMDFACIDDARKDLLRRESPKGSLEHVIAIWSKGDIGGNDAVVGSVGAWAEPKGIDAVVWTKLGPKFDEVPGKIPTVEDVTSYLGALVDASHADSAEEYIRKAPLQIATPYRRLIEERFGWTYDGSETDSQIDQRGL